MEAFADWLRNWLSGNPPANVWLGVSVEDQKRADERIPLLLQVPAAVRFLSVEPLLEKVDLKLFQVDTIGKIQDVGDMHPIQVARDEQIHWIIVGGESGKGRRDCGAEAICDVARQCVAAGVPIFVKQDAAFKPGQKGRIDDATWALKQFPKP